MVHTTNSEYVAIQPEIFKCELCGEIFPKAPHQRKKMCRHCTDIIKWCKRFIKYFESQQSCKNPNCNKRFTVTGNYLELYRKPWKKEYCSYYCYKTDSPEHISGKCSKCGLIFPVHKNYNLNDLLCSMCYQDFLRHQKCERCGKTFHAKKEYSLCLNCFFDNHATKCTNCDKILKKHRKRIITEENYNYLESLGFGKKRLSYFKISNMQYCDINCAIEKETPYYYKGIADEEYPPEFNSVLKRQIIQRDNSKCQLCDTNYNLAVHHIDYNKQNVDPTNLITLCKHHHTKTNWNRKYWVKIFSNYLLWRGLYD